MRTLIYSYIRTRDGDIIPWLERAEYYASRTVTDTVWSIDVYRYFPRKREQKNTTTPTPKECKDEHQGESRSCC
jgi:hypothetical protein